MHRKESTNPAGILRYIMGYTSMADVPLAIQCGKEKETVARDAYIDKVRNLGHKDIQCEATGLTLLPQHSYLGASSDMLISNHRYHKDSGVLEIKCPYSIEKDLIYKLSLSGIIRTYPQQFFSGRI